MTAPLDVAVIGLGRMGRGIAQRLHDAGHRISATDLDAETRAAARADGLRIAEGLGDLPDELDRAAPSAEAPRVFWVMVPAGKPVDDVLFDGPDALAPRLRPSDVVIDGGNSNFHDSMRRAERLKQDVGAAMLDCGTSGGVEGGRIGYCLMVGGPAEAYALCEPLLATIATADGYAHVGPSGAGHFVKMVHNAIEYAHLQAIGEGLSMIEASDFPVDLARLAELWTHGSVIRSWLMELAAAALEREHFAAIAPEIGGGSTGTWAVEEAARLGVKVPSIELALNERKSGPSNDYAARIVAALRWEFGRHPFMK